MTMATSRKSLPSRIPSGPIAFFVSIILVVVGTIQLVSTFHTYAVNLAELNSLRKTEASLKEKNQDLQNDIARWSDNEYVAAQARERLGFVFPGEQAIRVLHPEAVTGQSDDSAQTTETTHGSDPLPWYKELAYAFEQADQQDDPAQLPDQSASAEASPSDAASPEQTTQPTESSKDNQQ
ncbi:septum formation initiator [Bifidobacterium sp. DSM 109958]|uniref:Septum formation initiator n=1 Tax=Bifidobacterium moraviense TaxID=2675323 RepID=A0A7Y0HWR9_9BIFI|nr:septum formation initiator family protein [Bifidobacterium sp. DSM 109958]NMM99525.1 septum formation initiator [Bifidobacterium sp. DSM 109958]